MQETNCLMKNIQNSKLVEANIFLNLIFKYNYEISTLYSSNINNGISAETIELFGFPFSTSKDSKPKSGIGLNLDINYGI